MKASCCVGDGGGGGSSIAGCGTCRSGSPLSLADGVRARRCRTVLLTITISVLLLELSSAGDVPSLAAARLCRRGRVFELIAS